MTKHPWTFFAMLILWLSMNGSSSAGVIVAWNLDGEPGNQISTTAAFSADNVTGLSVSRGPGLIANSGVNSINSRGWDSLDSDDFYSFGFTIDSGYRVQLDQLLISTQSSATGPGTVVLRYSGDNFSQNLAEVDQSPGGNLVDSAIEFSALGLGHLTGDLEFRLYSASSISANGGTVGSAGTFRITNYQGASDGSFRFTGTVEAIPEPSSLALLSVLGVGAFGFWLRRRPLGSGLDI